MITQLALFSPYSIRKNYNEQWWKIHNYNGPKPGDILQMSSCTLGYCLNLKDYGCTNLNFGYVEAVNKDTDEVLIHCPLLKHAPWCKDKWYIIDTYECNPITMCYFDAEKFRTDNPHKTCPYEIEWGKYVEEYNKRYS